MAVSHITGVRLSGLASALPRKMITADQDAVLFGSEEIRKISEHSGVLSRHVASSGMCTSDLCYEAAQKLLQYLSWDVESIEALIFVSQTPDYLLPATSCVLHARLELAKSCACFDINLGCSGYIYGLWVASHLVSSGSARRVLLMVGDTISRLVSPVDRSASPLFGDAGTVTALESDSDQEMTFVLGTDGTGRDHLIVPAGGFRTPRNHQSSINTERENGNIRNDEQLFMNGSEIFTFTLREIPPLIKRTIDAAGWHHDHIDAYVLHQANQFMLNYLAKKIHIPKEKFIMEMANYGNTSSASIPLAVTSALSSRLKSEKMNMIMAGFGVGLSWGAVALTCGPMIIPELVFVDAIEDNEGKSIQGDECVTGGQS